MKSYWNFSFRAVTIQGVERKAPTTLFDFLNLTLSLRSDKRWLLSKINHSQIMNCSLIRLIRDDNNLPELTLNTKLDDECYWDRALLTSSWECANLVICFGSFEFMN